MTTCLYTKFQYVFNLDSTVQESRVWFCLEVAHCLKHAQMIVTYLTARSGHGTRY